MSTDAAAAAAAEHDAAIAPHDQALQKAHADAESQLIADAHAASSYADVVGALQTCDQAFRDAQARYDEAVAPIKQRFADALNAASELTSATQ